MMHNTYVRSFTKLLLAAQVNLTCFGTIMQAAQDLRPLARDADKARMQGSSLVRKIHDVSGTLKDAAASLSKADLSGWVKPLCLGLLAGEAMRGFGAAGQTHITTFPSGKTPWGGTVRRTGTVPGGFCTATGVSIGVWNVHGRCCPTDLSFASTEIQCYTSGALGTGGIFSFISPLMMQDLTVASKRL